MKRVLLLLSAIFIYQSSFATTYKTPNSGVVWTMDSLVTNSAGTVTGLFPSYNINDSLIISANDKLIVESGSELIFGTRGLTVRGSIVAIGTSESGIVFTGLIKTPASWEAIRIEDSAVDSACVFQYCTIEYSKSGIACIVSSPTITHSTLRYNGSLTASGNSYAIQCFQSNATIKYDSLYNNSQFTIHISNGSSPTIEYCVLLNNNVRNTSPNNQITVSFQGVNSPIIRHNEIGAPQLPFPLRAGGIGVGFPGASNTGNTLIEDNYIHDNAFGIVAASSSPKIFRNRIVNNNRVSNALSGGSGINVQASGASAGAYPIISGNRIEGNLWGVTIQSQSSGAAQPNLGDLTNADTTDDGKNFFLNNLQNGVHFALFNNTTYSVNAQNNYWGTTIPDSVATCIWGVGNVSAPSTITYLPFATIDLSLPVEFAYFTASQSADGVHLSWITESEKNNSGFEIERASDHIAFAKLGFVKGNGTTTEPQSYSFHDKAASGLVQYRLKQIDFDGSIHYSSIVEINSQHPTAFQLSQNYPNPFNPETVIHYQLSDFSDVKLEVFDMLGRKVATLINERQAAGRYQANFNASEFASGIYFYRIETVSLNRSASNFVQTKKMLLMK